MFKLRWRLVIRVTGAPAFPRVPFGRQEPAQRYPGVPEPGALHATAAHFVLICRPARRHRHEMCISAFPRKRPTQLRASPGVRAGRAWLVPHGSRAWLLSAADSVPPAVAVRGLISVSLPLSGASDGGPVDPETVDQNYAQL